MSTRAAITVKHRTLPLLPLLLVALAVLGLGLRPASAAQLPMSAASMTTVSLADRCTPSVSVSAGGGTGTGATATSVTVTGLGALCGGRDLSLTLVGAEGAPLTEATTTLPAGATGSVTVTVPAFPPGSVVGAAVTIGSWGIPVTEVRAAPPVLPLASCAVLGDPSGLTTCSATPTSVVPWGYPRLDQYNLYVTVTSPATTATVEWEVTINLADPSLLLVATRGNSNNAVAVAPGWTCASMPHLVLRGQSGPGTQHVGGGSSVTVWLHATSVASQSSGSLFSCS